jgi:hypothetical protein
MNDFSELEAELRKLRPAAASPELAARVEQALNAEIQTHTAGVMKRRSFQWNWLPLGLGIAAAAAFLVLARLNVDHAPKSSHTVAVATPVPAPPTPSGMNAGTFVPSGLTQVVYSTRDEGLQFAQGADRPVRRVRSQQRETLQWRNPQTGASLRVTYPAEEVTLTPVSGQ